MKEFCKYKDVEVFGKKYVVRVEVEHAGNGSGTLCYWVDPGTGCPPIVQNDLDLGLEWAKAEIAAALIR